jgi:signal transduction histidine kinase
MKSYGPINPANDLLPNLVNYLSHTAEELFVPTPIRCRLDVDKSVPAVPVSSEVRHHVYLTVREACNNIAKHSGATEVWLRFHLKESVLEISIQDNGRGFSEAPEAPTGQGLRNMRRRVEKIGGQFFCESTAGAGTLFRLTLPLPSSAPHASSV